MPRSLVVENGRARRLEWLRKSFAEHNRLVLLVAVLTLLVTAALWYLMFALLYWLAVLFASVVHGADARPPAALPVFFIYSAGLLLLLTWVARHRLENERPKDKKAPWEIAGEFLLAVPRATLAVWGNVSAWQRLDARELELAADLIEHIATERRMPLHQVPLEIPDPRDRMKILLALQLTELLRMSQSDGTVWLSLAPKSESVVPG